MVRRFPEPAVANPFRHRVEYTPMLILKLVLGAVFLLPIRLLGLVVVWPLAWLTIYIPTIGMTTDDHLPPWARQWMKYVATPSVRTAMFFFGFQWIEYTGERASYKDVPINVVAPHSTSFDGIFVGGLIYGSTLSCEEMNDYVITRALAISNESLLVDRSSAEKRAKVRDQMVAFLDSPRRQTHLMAFVEGTCSNGQSLVCFRRGAFLPGRPVQPILMVKDSARLATWTVDCYGLAAGILLQLCCLHTSLEIRMLDAYYPSEAEKEDPTLFANNVQAVMARSLGVAHTQHTQEDGLLSAKAMALGLPSTVGMIECGVVKSELGLNRDELKDQLKRYAGINVSKDGSLTLEQLSNYLAWPVSGHIEELFREYDTGHNQALTFRDFLFGLVDLAHAVPEREALQTTAFETMAGDGDIVDVGGVEQMFAKNDASVSTAEVTALLERWRVLSGIKCESGLSHDGLLTVLRLVPEYVVLLQWLLHGLDSFPEEVVSSAVDEPDRQRPSQKAKVADTEQ